MTTVPSPDYVRRQLQLADEAVDDARYLLQGKRLKAAANRAYYAMHHAIMAALAGDGVGIPRTHSGAISLFGRHFVRTGKVGRQFARDLQDVYNLRQQSDYEPFAEVASLQVDDAVAKAEAFVAEVKALHE